MAACSSQEQPGALLRQDRCLLLRQYRCLSISYLSCPNSRHLSCFNRRHLSCLNRRRDVCRPPDDSQSPVFIVDTRSCLVSTADIYLLAGGGQLFHFLLRQDRCLLLKQDRCLLLRQDRCLLLRQDTCLLLRQDGRAEHKVLG